MSIRNCQVLVADGTNNPSIDLFKSELGHFMSLVISDRAITIRFEDFGSDELKLLANFLEDALINPENETG